jgi:hypothetical protein
MYKYVRFKDGSWRYCRAALYANRTIKPDVVTAGGGNYCIACGGKWIPAGADALTAQRQQHALLSGNSVEYKLYSGRSVPKVAVAQPRELVANRRKKVKDEISQIPRGHGCLKAAGEERAHESQFSQRLCEPHQQGIRR